MIRSINPATERIFGSVEAELLGRHVSVLIPDEDRRDPGAHHRRHAQEGPARVLGAGRETIARRKNGSIFPIDISVSEARVGE